MLLAMLLVAGVMAAPQAPQATQAVQDSMPEELPVSLARIRAALDRPDLLTLHPVTPDFIVAVSERERFEKLVPPPDYRSGPVPPGGLYAYEQLQRSGLGSAQPLFLVDLIAIGRGIARAHASHEAAAARDEVRREIAAYCAAQPGAGAGIAICSK